MDTTKSNGDKRNGQRTAPGRRVEPAISRNEVQKSFKVILEAKLQSLRKDLDEGDFHYNVDGYFSVERAAEEYLSKSDVRGYRTRFNDLISRRQQITSGGKVRSE